MSAAVADDAVVGDTATATATVRNDGSIAATYVLRSVPDTGAVCDGLTLSVHIDGDERYAGAVDTGPVVLGPLVRDRL